WCTAAFTSASRDAVRSGEGSAAVGGASGRMTRSVLAWPGTRVRYPRASRVFTMLLTDGAVVMKCRPISSNDGGIPQRSVNARMKARYSACRLVGLASAGRRDVMCSNLQSVARVATRGQGRGQLWEPGDWSTAQQALEHHRGAAQSLEMQGR